MAESNDAIVIGAAYLARVGLKALVLERRGLGGACVTEEVWPGYRVSYVMSLLQPKIIRELKLRKFGFEVLPPTTSSCPSPTGGTSSPRVITDHHSTRQLPETVCEPSRG